MDATWTAVIAAGSAVVASATTGWFTTVAARTQARLNREMQAAQLRHAQVEHRYQQRRQSYAEFAKAAAVLHSRVGDMVSVAGDTDAFTQLLDEARADRAVLLSTMHVAFLEGPPAVGAAVRELYEAVNAFWSATRRLNDTTHSGYPAQSADHRARTNQRRIEARASRDAFVEAARGFKSHTHRR
ncbi:hypothetical protein OHA37_27220 [Streptomyces sp. NBC_00335]|uniref:hypothetical protein n=1 Tax=unclassified Streptomyces TaxID=2593676 RepID=UPI002252849B|nr:MULTISPECIES: hypothetical protein [unclassified Streptomyces]MCX5407541.1 hypothetical protein [Streptomyces sp. NBC_00086]